MDYSHILQALQANAVGLTDETAIPVREAMEVMDPCMARSILAAKLAVRDQMVTFSRMFMLTGTACAGPRLDKISGGYITL